MTAIDAAMTTALVTDRLVLANSLVATASHNAVVQAAYRLIVSGHGNKLPLLMKYGLELEDLTVPGFLDQIFVRDDVETFDVLNDWGLTIADVLELGLFVKAVENSSCRIMTSLREKGLPSRLITARHVSIALAKGDVCMLSLFVEWGIPRHTFYNVDAQSLCIAIRCNHVRALEIYIAHAGDVPAFHSAMAEVVPDLLAGQHYEMLLLLLSAGIMFEKAREEEKRHRIQALVMGSHPCGFCGGHLFTGNVKVVNTLNAVSVAQPRCGHLHHLSCTRMQIAKGDPYCPTCARATSDDLLDYTLLEVPSLTPSGSVLKALIWMKA